MSSPQKNPSFKTEHPSPLIANIRPPLESYLYPTFCFFFGLLLISKIIGFLPLIQTTTIGWKTFSGSLALVISFHLILFILARLYQKIYTACHFLFLYMILLLSIYLLFIINNIFFSIPDRILVRLSLLLLTFPLLIRWKDIQLAQWRWPHFSYKDILIALWTLNAFLFFARFNLNVDRLPYIDEIHLWYVASRDMIQHGVLIAHTFPYPGAGAYPLGIPFISSLPALFWGSLDLRTIYLMPIANILCLVFFLNHIKTSRWGFLFFLCALSAVFYQRAWLSFFLYGLTYGEGLSTIFLLITTFQWIRISDDPTPSPQTVWWTSAGIGLLALTKGPLTTLTLPIFLIFLASLIWNKKSLGQKISVREIFFSTALAILPSLSWKAFTVIWPVYTLNFSHLLSAQELLTRLPHPHQWMLTGLFFLMWGNSNNFFFYGPLALLLYICFSKKLVQGTPLLILLSGAFIYYAFYYNYGINAGDPGSSLRYSMPAFLALFYLGSRGFENLMRSIEESAWPSLRKMTMYTALYLPMIWGLAETKTAEKIVNLITWVFRGFSS
ncbi:MAG: hypothetical protein HQL21_02550 [Candidatus Omnitrophica bacterium]|nr:hypothetical protein [Candidatus Omnitrophota bacterium]